MAVLVVHGGAGSIGRSRSKAYEQGLAAALDAGMGVLHAGGAAADAVLTSVVAMEDNPEAFNAGTGAALTSQGTVESDAAVMVSDGSCGAVAVLSVAKNPVLIADMVRTTSPHVLIAGSAADDWVEHAVENHTLITEWSLGAWRKWRESGGAPVGTATVGAVALDSERRLAAATSTGGVTGQKPGRVGDSPVFGAGTYASARVAVSCTGLGEAFMRAVAAKEVAMRLEYGAELSDAVRLSLARVAAYGGHGGMIALSADGKLRVIYNSQSMAFGWDGVEGRRVEVGTSPGLAAP